MFLKMTPKICHAFAMQIWGITFRKRISWFP